MSAKGPPEAEVHSVKECLALVHGIEEADHNNLGIVQALKECHGNVQNAAQYYNHNHYSNVPGYSRDADTNVGDSSDEEYNHPASKRRRTGGPTKYAPTKYTNKGSTRNNEPSTTNNKPSTTGGRSQGLRDSRKRNAEEGKFKIRYVV